MVINSDNNDDDYYLEEDYNDEVYISPLDDDREKRRGETAEVFTPPELVNEILDKLPNEVWESDKTFCDPAAGNGNIILEVIKRKLSHGHTPTQALSTTYAVELMEDNVLEMKERVLNLFEPSMHEKLRGIINKNIVCSDAFKWDFENWTPIKSIKNKKLF